MDAGGGSERHSGKFIKSVVRSTFPCSPERERERERKRTRGRWWRWKWADVLEIIKDLQPDGCCCHFFLVFLSFFIFSIVLLVPHPHFLTRRSISWLGIFCLPLYFTVFHLDLSLFPCLTCLTEVYNDFLVKIFIGLHEVLLMVELFFIYDIDFSNSFLPSSIFGFAALRCFKFFSCRVIYKFKIFFSRVRFYWNLLGFAGVIEFHMVLTDF